MLNENTLYVSGFYIPPSAARISGSAIHQSIIYSASYLTSGITIVNKSLENPHILLFIQKHRYYLVHTKNKADKNRT